MQTSTLRPGLLVSLKTSITGNISYRTRDIEAQHIAEDGAARARWETERTIADLAEHEEAVKVRGKCRSLITATCAASSFGLLCPDGATDRLDEAVAEAQRMAAGFNATARLSRIGVYVIAGRIAPDDLEAVRAINSEVRELLADMERGLQNLDVKTVREAANKARAIGTMLSPAAAERIQVAIETARSAARRIVKAAEIGAAEIDRAAIRKITESRTAFLDVDGEAAPITVPTATGRALDLTPEDAMPITAAPAQSRLFDID